MGVMECSRFGCEEIMCNRLLKGRYICGDCYSEFVNLDDCVGSKSEKEWNKLFSNFMKSDKRLGSNKIISFNDFLNKLQSE